MLGLAVTVLAKDRSTRLQGTGFIFLAHLKDDDVEPVQDSNELL